MANQADKNHPTHTVGLTMAQHIALAEIAKSQRFPVTVGRIVKQIVQEWLDNEAKRDSAKQ